ncbi:MAG: ABC transporter ATP-binding protein [Flexilinea sp.]|nr:ABC transporter ATP-binding protein [Flexilinea sp.]
MQFKLENVAITYPQTDKALDCINLEIEKGDFIGIVGRSGSGKTTLLHTIGGLLKPQSGSIFFEGFDIYSNGFDQLNYRRKLQIIFQFPENQFFESSIYDEASFGLKMLKFPADIIAIKTLNVLNRLSFDEKTSKILSPFSLSGGQKRRLAIACSLAMEPEVLLLDEPFAGLDEEGKEDLIQILRKENKKGTTILLVSHDPDLLCEIAEKILVLSDGKIICMGTPVEIYNTDNMNFFGIGSPNTKKLADLLSLEMTDNLTYNSFIAKLVKKLSAPIS